MQPLIRWFDILLQVITVSLIVMLAVIVVLGVGFRYSGNSLIWYDEVAAVLLAWITFFGAALAMLRNAHMGFNGLLFGLPMGSRLALFWLVEAIVLAILAVVLWGGWAILDIFGDESLVTLRFVPRAFVQGVLPVAAGLMIVGRLLTLGPRRAEAHAGVDPETREIELEIQRAQADLDRRAKDYAQ